MEGKEVRKIYMRIMNAHALKVNTFGSLKNAFWGSKFSMVKDMQTNSPRIYMRSLSKIFIYCI